MTTYGNGPGDGPGEIQIYKSVGLWRDSLYVLDPRNRRLSFFSTSGSFGRSEQYRRRVRSVVWTGDSTRYENYLGPGVPFLMEITKPSGQQTTVSDLQTQDVSSIVLDGILHPATGRAVYVLYYYPLLLTFAPGDTTAMAYPTPDHGTTPVLKPRTEGEPGRQVIRPPSSRLHIRSVLHEGVLAVQIPAAEDSLAFDVCDTREMHHMHSVRLPIATGSAWYAYASGLLAVERDTTVEVYNVEPLEKEAL